MAKIHTLQNPFDTNTTGFDDVSSGGGSATITGGALRLDSGGVGGVGSMFPTGSYDLSDSAIYIQVPSWPTKGTWRFHPISIEGVGGHGYRIRYVAGTGILLDRMTAGSGSPIVTIPFNTYRDDLLLPCWWQIREASGTTYIEKAPDLGTGLPGTFVPLVTEATNTNPSFDPTLVSPGFAIIRMSDDNAIVDVAGYNTAGKIISREMLAPQNFSPLLDQRVQRVSGAPARVAVQATNKWCGFPVPQMRRTDR